MYCTQNIPIQTSDNAYKDNINRYHSSAFLTIRYKNIAMAFSNLFDTFSFLIVQGPRPFETNE